MDMRPQGGAQGSVTQENKPEMPKGFKNKVKYVRDLLKGFFYRLFYIVKLVWEAKKTLLILMIFMSIFNGVAPVIAAYISANLLNKVALVIGGTAETMKEVVKILLPALMLQFGYMFFINLVNSVSNIVTRTSNELVTNHVKMKIMNKAKDVDLSSFDMPEFYEKLENANREAGTRPVQVISSTFAIVSTLISAISFITILAAIAWFAPLIVVILSIPSAIITFTYRKKTFNYMRKKSKERRQMAYYSDTLVDKDLVKELKLFNLSDTFIVNYNKVFEKYFHGIKGLIIGEGLWNIGITLVSTCVNCGLFFFIAYTITRGTGKIGDYSLYTGALTSIASCVSSLVGTVSHIYEGTLFIDNMIVFMNEEKKIVPSLPEARHVDRHIGHTIELSHVSFRYPGSDHDVIHDINLTINAGETVVMVGLNGAGKTTLIKLITRLYDPTEGTIYLDGHDIKEYDTKELYAMFGIIFQDYGKYAFTIKENIAFGQIDKGIVDSEIVDAAKAGAASEFINGLPLGYDTPLMRIFETTGKELSIGQWQKLAVARAFYSDSDVLILDEPTASLDAIAEQEIFNQFDTLREGKTTIFVSHRLSSATVADKIIVLDGGRLAELGNHSELMAQKGEYYKLFTTQAERYIESSR